ncbi:TlpA family protein disulfide reductase [Aeromonas rivipollensis]|uniref:TlpA family protein disulfide reductase n=1 Tax=Aeromonas rivipollensis TaxID=948519 RepID=UPI00259DFAB9|nr:TlpA disulfide reductase family protein [Aeromonas rivipollensis]MDM5086652.1 TlpA family protein disulfide reductase [Aeromonas rivipollensis]MDM5098636.1 TlpA family protein disulfide reductase [Aeromonas rivipollensis]MDM5107092.1 TlpA family protein disulfide reductase [Aeromonas rivipollensis]
MGRVSGRAVEMKRICWLIVAALLGACTPAPQFTDGTGKNLSLSALAGKPLLVNYFAPWCAPCLREMPRLNALAAEGQIAVVAINYDPTTPAELGQLATRYEIKVPLLIANADASLPFPRPGALPTSYLLDSEGKLKQTLVGELDQQQIEMLRAAASSLSH